MKTVSDRPWHALDTHAVITELQTAHDGLPQQEAARRLEQHGRNELPAPAPEPTWKRLLRQINNPLILFLLSAAVVAFALGHLVDAIVIVMVVVINALVGYIQEGKAERALNALSSVIAQQAHVLRDGKRRKVEVGELVPGDIVILEAGDRVPADARIVRSRNLLVDESILTGESVTAEKGETGVATDAGLSDRTSMLYSGTLVATGQVTAAIVATGRDTQLGHIGRLLSNVQAVSTPLLQQIARFGRLFTFFALGAAALLFLFAVGVRDYTWLDALMVVVALSVGVVPESLPAVITITLAIGVRRMAARNAIIRRLPAVETLGATTVICSDKTGTLTRNEMTAHSIVTATGVTTASGSGYAPQGELRAAAGGNPKPGHVVALASIGALCNDAQLRCVDDAWHVNGDPMEGALLALAAKAGLDTQEILRDSPRLDEIPFDAAHRYMATLHRRDGTAVICVKGAPEQMLALSRSQFDGSEQPLDLAYWENAIAAAGAKGERVLGFAWRELAEAPEHLSFEHVANLTFAGLVGFIDPPREEAIAAVAQCHEAGIDVKMITGDHAATAQAIARQLRLAENPVVVTGAELENLPESELTDVAHAAQVFARASPEHKLRLVRALQSQGAIVAMTGDGVNDAPALKQADIGVAMGRKGTEAAKEASEMVLTDDNFASISAAVYEGRAVYDNIRKVIAWTVPTNGGEAMAVITALVFGMVLPMTALHILWINMVLTITLGLALAFEPPESGIMQRNPRRANEGLISPFMLWRIILVSVIFTVAALGVFYWAIARGLDVPTARTLVVNTFCVLEIFYLFSVRYMHSTSFTLRGMKGTPAVLWAITGVVVAQLAFTYLPWLQAVFDSRPVAFADLVVIVLIGFVMLVVLELEKALLRKLGVFEELGTRRAR